MTIKLFVVALILTTLGCAQNHVPADLAVTAKNRNSVRNPNLDKTRIAAMDSVLTSVLELPVVETQQSEALPELESPASSNAVPIKTSLSMAADAQQYFLETDPNTELVYILRHGGIADHLHSRLGPWRSSHPKVASLISLVQSQEQ